MSFKTILVAFLVAANFSISLGDEIFFRNPLVEGKGQKETKSIRGTLKEDAMTADEVSIAPSSKTTNTVETANIEAIKYDHEPKEFEQIRDKYVHKDYQGAYDELQVMINEAASAKIDLAFYNEMIKQEFEFLQAYLPAMTTLTGTSKEPAGKVAGPLVKFLTDHPKHYRYYEGMATIGHLALLTGGERKLEFAKKYYGALNTSSQKEIKAEMNLFYSRALLTEGKTDEINTILSGVAQDKSDANIKSFASTIQQAKITLAAAQAVGGQLDEATKRLEQIIDETPASDREAHAWASLTLGNIYNAKKQKMDALMAFLKIDLLLGGYPELHAEALAKLAKLWNEIPNPKAGSANEAKEKLQSLYPYSKWNK